MTVNKKQGQAPTKDKDGSTHLYGLSLNKEELSTVHSAIQIDYETLTELAKEDRDWLPNLRLVNSVLNKVRKLEEDIKAAQELRSTKSE